MGWGGGAAGSGAGGGEERGGDDGSESTEEGYCAEREARGQIPFEIDRRLKSHRFLPQRATASQCRRTTAI